MKNKYEGMKESLQVIEQNMNPSYHYSLAIQSRGDAWGLCIKLYHRDNWAQPQSEVPRSHSLPNPLFQREEEARLFLCSVNFPLVFKEEQLIGCIDNTSEDFVYRPIDDTPVSVDNSWMAYTEMSPLVKDLESNGCTVINLY